MWDWINCHVAGRHEYSVWSDSNRMFLRCLRCGRRSNGWDVAAHQDDAPAGPRRIDARAVRQRRGGLMAGALSLFGLLPFLGR